MDLENIQENDIVCLRYVNDSRWVLFTKWTSDIKVIYNFAHSLPHTPGKHNIEPIFKDSIYKCIETKEQTPDRLKQIYKESEKCQTRMKILEHKLFCVL